MKLPRQRAGRSIPCLLIYLALTFLVGAMLSACSAAGASQDASPTATECPTPDPQATAGFCGAAPTNPVFAAATRAVEAAVLTSTPAAQPSPTTPAQPATLAPTAVEVRLATPTPCAEAQCSYPGVLPLARPIHPSDNDSVDITYRFGSTQAGKRDPHHGVEFLNRFGTPVLAAADGTVVVAGDDRKTIYGPYPNFYGNLVVLEHDLPGFPGPVYTLYAHLSEILVTSGQEVDTGEEIGKVGMGGAATGSHLHLEVRLGENTYAAAHNPELWLKPHLGDAGQPNGALAGRVVDQSGKTIAVKDIVIQHLPEGETGPSDWEIYLVSYEEKALLGRPPWYESFATGDLPAGWYRITFPYFGLQSQVVQVLPGQLTVVTFRVK